jgi:sec-independent protein translocase protein TatB
MDIFGIGLPEILFIIVIILVLFGPKDIAVNARKAAKFIRRFLQSPLWQDVQGTSREIRDLPTKLMREAGLEELKNDVKSSVSIDPRSWGQTSNDAQQIVPPQPAPAPSLTPADANTTEADNSSDPADFKDNLD